MKQKFLYLFIYIALVAACSSNWDDQYGDKAFEAKIGATLNVDIENMEFTNESSSQQFSVIAQSYWSVKSSDSWLKVSGDIGHGNATLTVTVEANTSTTQVRQANIVVTNNKETRTITVKQLPMEEQLTIDGSSFAYGYQGGTNYVGVTANVGWTVSSAAAWLTIEKGENGVTITAQPNISLQPRQAEVTVRGVRISHTIQVSQQGVVKPAITGMSAGNVTKNSAIFNFTFSSPDIDVTEYGVCYSNTTQDPNLQNASVQNQSGGGRDGNVMFQLTGLKSKTTYYVRPYIVTALGIEYGGTTLFTTPVSAPNENDNGTPND